jgi:hypothetical protein
MKKKLTLSLIAILFGTASLQADIYITGSTAFSQQAYAAIKAMYGTGLTAEYPSPGSGDNNMWILTGNISILNWNNVVVHASFTGSVKGVYLLYNNTDTQVYYADTSGNLITNTATCAFSDVDSVATSYPLDSASFIELHVAVQPFVWVRNAAASTTISNVSMQQLQSLMPSGKVPLYYLTDNFASDSGRTVWLVNGSLASGARTVAYADEYITGSPVVYYWNTNAAMYGGKIDQFVVATNYLGPALFSYGYVGGGDVVSAMNLANTNTLAYLGIADAKNVNGGVDILSDNGFYPSSDIKTGSAVPTAPSFDRIRSGQYSFWSYECLDYPRNISYGGQDITFEGLDEFCRTLASYDSNYNFVPNSAGSIDHQINVGTIKVAIRLGDMNVTRSAVGGPIAP